MFEVDSWYMASPQYVEIRAKSVLNRVEGMPFQWSVNPYRGCLHGCVFCYARRTHWFIGEDGVDGWSGRIYVKTNAPEVLRRELSRPTWYRETIALGTATDPYQPAERKYHITRGILEALRDFRTPVSVVTRSPLIRRDADVLAELDARAGATVCFSIATMDAALSREIEPTVAPPLRRLAAMCELVSAGLRAGVLLAPILPGITDSAASIAAVMEAAKAHGAHFVWHNALHLGEVTKQAFFAYLRSQRPADVPAYARLYRGKYAPAEYRENLRRLVEAENSRVGFPEERYVNERAGPTQLALV